MAKVEQCRIERLALGEGVPFSLGSLDGLHWCKGELSLLEVNEAVDLVRVAVFDEYQVCQVDSPAQGVSVYIHRSEQ